MRTQDDFVLSNMGGERKLERSSWKAEAIRKGNLKISGPIPITEDTPLSEEEERRYAGKHETEPLDPSSQPSEPQPQSTTLDHSHAAPDLVEAQPQPQPQLQGERAEARPKTPLTELQAPTEAQRNQRPVSRSIPSPFLSIPESTTKTPPKKKRKSGLRNAIRKMFGKKSKDEDEDEEDTLRRAHGHHVSDPGLSRNSPKPKDTTSGPQISSLHVHEPVPLNPFGQRLPFPMNVNAPQEASSPHDYLILDVPSADLNRRRATLPSILHANSSTQSLSTAKQVASWEERLDGDLPSPQIGIALSSPSQGGHAQSIRSKRRSRSAGALRDLAKSRTSIERRRSAEIRYWRQSYQSASICNTNTSRPRTAQTIETFRTVDSRDYATKEPESTAVSSTMHTPSAGQRDQDSSQIQLPVEAFNFGNLKSGFSDDENHQEEHARSARPEKRLSMEERVQYLEDDLRTIETSVNRISGHSKRQTIVLENAPKGRRSLRSSKSSNVTLSANSRHSPSAPPSPILVPPSSVSDFPQSQPPPATAAERSASPPRAPASYRSELASQFAAIYDALKHERTSRTVLEKQVISLQREISEVHALVNKIHTHSPSYPTPSPDVVIASSEERMSTPRASTRPDLYLGIDGRGHRSMQETKLGWFDNDRSDRDESSSDWSSKDGVTSPETWATPKEESGSFFGKSRSRLDLNEGEGEMF